MYGRTNAGGGGNSPFAFIFATYPAGSVCTCADGSRTLKLKDTSGYGVFYPPNIGTWTVTATDGTDTASETVEITKEGENVSVELSYTLWLYKNGDQCVDVTGGWSNSNYVNGGVAYNPPTFAADNMQYTAISSKGTGVGTVNPINFKGKTTLHLEALAEAGLMYCSIVSTKNYTTPLTYIQLTTNNTKTEYTLDVSAIETDAYIFIFCGPSGKGNVYNVRLE